MYAGLNASQISGDELWGFNKPGAYLGLATGQEFKTDHEWEFGLLFSQRGSFKNKIAGDPNRRYLLTMNYIDAPILYRFTFKVIKVEAGISNGFLVSYKESNSFGPVNDPRKFSRYDLSGIIGLQYDLNEQINFCARVSNSILPVRPHASGAVDLYNRGQYHSVIHAAIVYRFRS